MLIHPAAIVAFLLSLIVGPLTVSQRFQARFKSLGHGVHHKISSVLSLPRIAFEPQDYSVAFEATAIEALPIVPAETNVVHPVEIIPPCPVPLEDYVEVVIQEVGPTRHDGHPTPAPARIFVVSSEYQGPFHWRDLFNYQALDVLTAIYVSIWFLFVVIPFFAKLLSRSESLDEIERPVDVPPKLLPPKILAPPKTVHIQISNSTSYAPPEPIFSPAPPELPTFWLAPEQQQQDQPPTLFPTLLRLLGLPALGNESQEKLSPLSSPADSGYGTTLPDTALGASPIVSDESVTTTPEHLAEPLLIADQESASVLGSKSVTTTSGNVAGEKVDDTELEDDDDGSTTVTNSTANLADLIVRPGSVSAEVLAAKLESVTAALIEETKPFPEPPVEGPSVKVPPSNDSAADLPSHDEPAMDLPSDNEPAAYSATATQESAVGGPSVDVCPPFEHSSDATDTIVDPVYVEKKAVAGIGLVEDETVDDLPSQDDSEQDVESWKSDCGIPTIIISPPSEVDPEDSAQQFDSEDEQEESGGRDIEDEPEPESEHEEAEYDDDSELEYADDCPGSPVSEVVLEMPPSPVEVRDDPCRSPITTGKLWSDDEGDDLGPPPVFEKTTHVEVSDTPETSDTAGAAEQLEVIGALEQTEVQDSTVEEEILDTVTATPEDSDTDKPVVEAAEELVEEPQPAPEAPAQEVVETVPVVPVRSLSPSTSPQIPPRVTRSYPIRAPTSFDNENRGEGNSRSGRTLETPRLQYFHCCKLYRSDGRPKSWEHWKIEKPAACIPMKTHLQEWQFVCPTDQDGKNPTTRIAIDNLDADWFRMVGGVPSYNYLTEAMGFFTTKYFRCWRGRTIDGVEYPAIGYATVDFDSPDAAVRMFDELQGRRLRGHTWHWRLEFVDPNDDTHGGRRVIRTELVSDSVKQALAAELEASTRHGKSGRSDEANTDTAAVARPPTRVRPQLSVGGRSLFAGAMSNVVQGRRTQEQPAQSRPRVPPRRPYRS